MTTREQHSSPDGILQLGGLDNLKAFCLRAMRRQGNHDPLRRPRGVLLLSPPGCGKSQFAKALGNETGRPTLTLDADIPGIYHTQGVPKGKRRRQIPRDPSIN